MNAWGRLEPRMPIFQEREGQVSQEKVGSSGVLDLALANSCWLIPA